MELTDDHHRSIAARANNEAWGLLESDLDQGGVARLLTLAATARHHWHEIGTPSQKAHADMLFGWALARAASPLSGPMTSEALAYFETGGATWEMAFAHAACAAAALVAEDAASHADHYAKAQALGAELTGDDAKYFRLAFRTVPSA